MTWRGRRRGVFEGLPRVFYRRTRARYIDACAAAVVLNGVAVAGFGVVTLVLYVDVRGGELALFAACSAAWYAVEGLVAAICLRRAAATRRSRRGRPRPGCQWRSCVRAACTRSQPWEPVP